MITIENPKNVLSEIGFEKSDIGDYYKIDYTGCSMAVDFDNAKLIYPEKKGLVVNDRTTLSNHLFLMKRFTWLSHHYYMFIVF